MAKSRFKTRLSKTQRRNNVLGILAAVAGSYAFSLGFGAFLGIYENWDIAEVLVISMIGIPFMLVMPLAPIGVIALLLGAQRGKAKRVRHSSTFAPVQGLTYYRDSLDKLSPALVSLLVDLDIYGYKDIAAMLLRMHNKGAVAFEKGGRIIATNSEASLLDSGERELLALVQAGKAGNKKALAAWKQHRFIEAERLGYIQKQSGHHKKRDRLLVPMLLSVPVAIVLWGVMLNTDFYENPVPALTLLVAVGAVLAVPWYLFVRESVYINRGDVCWQRTPLGNETAEKIAGLSRFMHEFSVLSEAGKEQVKLWDDYLVYAIVLEENERIVKEICRQNRIRYRRYAH
ncbi:MAG: DUF2207 domain-containing protein [Coriobacteriales bacterium]|jgi:hypothetical protein|nr:DUF2207 domain-containing protein [Coriobacteriales bacterium]